MVPASNEPITRDTFIPSVFKPIAACNSVRGTTSGIMLCQVGIIIAIPMPSSRVSPSRLHAVMRPLSVITPIMTAAIHMPMLPAIRYLRRSKISDKAPDGSRIKKAGSEVAVCIKATNTGEVVRVVINQPAPASCIHEPILETKTASQRYLNVVIFRGDQGDCGLTVAVCDIVGE